MSPNNGYKTTCNTLYHKVIEISSVLSSSWPLFHLSNAEFSCFWIELIKDEKMKSKLKTRVTVRAVSVSRQTLRVLVGEAPQSLLTSPLKPVMSWASLTQKERRDEFTSHPSYMDSDSITGWEFQWIPAVLCPHERWHTEMDDRVQHTSSYQSLVRIQLQQPL